MSPGDPAWLAALADNLACRGRLGLDLVSGGQEDLRRLLSLLAPAEPRQPVPHATPPDTDTPTGTDLAGEPQASPDGLAQVRAAMGECTRCPLHQQRRSIVFGQGDAHARVMFIGEGPGAEEDRQGLPFVGPAGRLLDRMLAAVGLDRREVYITNIVKCRPPGNRDPRPEEVAACRPFLEEQVRAIAPQIICTLGRPAVQALLGREVPISAVRGNWHSFQGVPLLPMFHPAYLLRSPERKAQAYQDLKTLVRALRQGPPEV